MADDQDDAQKTEEPTQKRLQEAHDRGQVITSRETASFFMLLAFTLLLGWMAPGLFRRTHEALAMFIERPEGLAVDQGGLGQLLSGLIAYCGGLLLVPFAAFLAAVFIGNAAQNRFVFSSEPIVPKLEKISIIKGIGRLFSLRSVTELVKGVIKIIIVGWVAYKTVSPYFMHFKQLPDTSLGGMLAALATLAGRMMISICIVMFFIAIIDYLYQRFDYRKGLRMSKQEIKEEFKQMEGDPHIKGRLRQIRMERARKRMMAAVPGADVIITNPTHYSIALKYDGQAMRAPLVVAKGVDLTALRMREIAAEHNVPLYENPPLAQALYATVEIDKEVPPEHYRAVAEVISYVYRLRGRRVQAG